MALNDAVPSSATDVFKRNAEDTDKLVNGVGSVTTRTGKILPSWDEITTSHAAWNNRGAWATATAYAVNDIWSYDGNWYLTLTSYTSAASAAADIAGDNVTALQSKTENRFEGVSDAVAAIILNPELFTINSAVSTSSEKTKSECDALSISFPDGGGAEYVVVSSGSGSTSSGEFIDAGSLQLKLDYKRKKQSGGAVIIFDDGNATSKNELMPIAVAEDFKTGLALYHSGIAASYTFVTMSEALEFKKIVDGEILSHSMNPVGLTSDVDLTYGESLIRTSAEEFRQFDFAPRGFVAPNSTLDSKFKNQLQQSYDFAFVRSVGAGAGVYGINKEGDDRYNLVRVSLEAITLVQAKSYVDLARVNDAFLCFYTHTDTGYIQELMAYIKNTYSNINATEWIGSKYGLNKSVAVNSTKNLLANSAFREYTDGIMGEWSFVAGTLQSPTISLNENEGGALVDLECINSLAGDSGTLSQNYFFPKLAELTPFCFSLYARSLAVSNTQVRLEMYAKDSGNTTVSSIAKTFDISANRQRISLQQTFIANATVDHVLVVIKFIAKGAGGIRALFDSPQLEKSGAPTAYKKSGLPIQYGALRKTTGQSVPPNTDTVLQFNSKLMGSNNIFDLNTYTATPQDGRVYTLEVSVGLDAMVAGDLLMLFLIESGNPVRPNYHTCTTGKNIVSVSWDILASGSEYSIGIRHNSSAARAATTYGDAVLHISAQAD